MSEIVECIPNFSEGRNKEIIDKILEPIESVEGVKLLGAEMDADHNRTVVTFIGEREQVKEAAFGAVKRAAELIDLNEHEGEHPRMGATDVVPFVPIRNITMKECAGIAKDVGKRIGDELGIPVFLYESAAERKDRKNLAKIRKGEFEGLKEKIGVEDFNTPDYGPNRIHGTAGATAVGARMPLIAYNVNLDTDDLEIAKKIARSVRHISGGFRYVKAMGFEIKERNIVQVSMNLVNYKKTPVFRVFETIRREAKRYGVNVLESEIIGLIPADALYEVADYYLRVAGFDKGQVLENRIYGGE